jgi:uncharacterized protein (DUF427 family)
MSKQPTPAVESVWDYPRPPRVERVHLPIAVQLNGVTLAATDRAWRVLETAHPPTYYIPPEDVAMQYLHETSKRTFCEWKGAATYFTVQVGEVTRRNAGWCYRKPRRTFASITDMVTFYAGLMDRCWVGDELVSAQAGDFYGGWITSWISGPFKGAQGTAGW